MASAPVEFVAKVAVSKGHKMRLSSLPLGRPKRDSTIDKGESTPQQKMKRPLFAEGAFHYREFRIRLLRKAGAVLGNVILILCVIHGFHSG